MDNEERILAWCGFALIVLGVLLQLLEWFEVTPSFLPSYSVVIVSIFLVAGLTIAIVALVRAWKRRHHILDPRFKHLSIHYSSRTDKPDTKPTIPYFVKNQDTNQAYWVSDLIEAYVRRRKIQWNTHDNEKELKTYFKSQGTKINDRNPTDKELGLWLKSDGSLMLAESKLEPEMLERLKKLKLEGKLKKYQIAFLYPWYLWFLRSSYLQKRAWPPNRRIIANVFTREAFGAPQQSLDLVGENIISADNYTPRPSESISKWCKRKKGWTFNERRFTVEELAGVYE